MKLEIKHLAPYLPYDLKCWVKDYSLDVGDKPANEIYTLDALYRIGKLECVFHDLVESNRGFKEIKPILKPLSDLKKNEIEMFEYFNEEVIINQIIEGDTQHYGSLEYSTIQWLCKSHYDFQNLIPQGLAIDINKLTK